MNASSGYSSPKRGDRNWRERETDEAGEAFDRRVKAQTRLLRAACEPWLARGRAVRLIYDRTFAFQNRGDMTGRMGTIAVVPGPPFTDFVHVSFEPKGRQRVTRELMVELEAVEPIDAETPVAEGQR